MWRLNEDILTAITNSCSRRTRSTRNADLQSLLFPLLKLRFESCPRFQSNQYPKYVISISLSQFANEEFECNKDTKKFVTENYGVTFDMFSKVNVKKGTDIHPIFTYLIQSDVNGNREIKWNFDGKFVLDRNGKVIARFTNKDDLSDLDKFIAKHT